MDQVIQDFVQQGILRQQEISAAYRSFLVAKADQSARFVIDLSPLTPQYRVPHITLYSTARVLATIQPFDTMLTFDLVSGFYQIKLRADHSKFYGIYYRGKRYAFTRLPMGHALAPYILQRLALAVSQYLNQHLNISMVAYLRRLAGLRHTASSPSHPGHYRTARLHHQLPEVYPSSNI
jgi:hypothetical protein